MVGTFFFCYYNPVWYVSLSLCANEEAAKALAANEEAAYDGLRAFAAWWVCVLYAVHFYHF